MNCCRSAGLLRMPRRTPQLDVPALLDSVSCALAIRACRPLRPPAAASHDATVRI